MRTILPGQFLKPEQLFKDTRRCFHIQNPDEPKVAQHVAYNERRKHKDDDTHSYEKEPNKFAYIIKNGVLTAAFVIFCFGLSDIKASVNDFKNLLHRFGMSAFGGQLQVRGGMNMYDLNTSLIFRLNAIVFLLWKVPSMQETMRSAFLINPTLKPTTFATFILSAFSHSSFLHIFINMYALNSFINVWTMFAFQNRQSMPKDYMSEKKLMTFYVTAAAVAGFASHTYKILGGIKIPSLGASGTIYALLEYMCTKAPNLRLRIVFLPLWSFSASSGLKALMLFDSMGLALSMLTRGRYFILDHAGHLGGALFGLWYARYGEAYLHRWSKCVSKHVKPDDERGRRR